MMVDGGKGQLSVAKAVLDEHGLADQPVIGLAKKLEEVFIPGQSGAVYISKTSPALNLLKRVRDEAHRFAITYHRKLRSKRTVGSELDLIPGVGPARRAALLKHFGSVKKIKEAAGGIGVGQIDPEEFGRQNPRAFRDREILNYPRPVRRRAYPHAGKLLN
jgi:excinuclease ABC subunit C